MQPRTPPKAAVLLLLFFLCAQRVRSFALHPYKTTKTPYGKRTYQHYTTQTASSASSAPRQARTTAPLHYSCNTHRSISCPWPADLPFARITLVDRAPSLCAAVDATGMASEADMPVLRVLTVDEVPTLKADPVDPIAREQAKVRCVGLRCVAFAIERASSTTVARYSPGYFVFERPNMCLIPDKVSMLSA